MGLGSGAGCAISLNSILTADEQARYQDPDCIQDVLRRWKTIAIVGLSADRQKASYFVATYLQHEGYRVIPVNPRRHDPGRGGLSGPGEHSRSGRSGGHLSSGKRGPGDCRPGDCGRGQGDLDAVADRAFEAAEKALAAGLWW